MTTRDVPTSEPDEDWHELDTDAWTCSCGEECWTPEAYADHLAEVNGY